MSYQPRPIDTAHVTLPPDLVELTELLSRNAHDRWAQVRFEQGWRHGARRDDTKKEHPCLVPYEQLSESEKQLDRATAMETLKAILALGYKIEK